MMSAMVDAAVSPEASSLDVTKLPATYDDIDARLTEIENMLQGVVQFVNDARAAIEAMPSLPFMPKFPKGIGK